MTIVELTKSLIVPAELVIGCSRLTSRSTRSTHLSTRSTYLPAFSIRSNRLSIHSTRLFAGSLRLSTRNTCLSIRLSTHSTCLPTRSTYLSSFSIKKLALELAPFSEKGLYGKFFWFSYIFMAFLMSWAIIFGQKCLPILKRCYFFYFKCDALQDLVSVTILCLYDYSNACKCMQTLFFTFLSFLSVCMS